MTQDEITALWQKSMDDAEGMRLGHTTQQHYFANLVAEATKEKAAKVCEEWFTPGIASEIAAAIRSME